MHARPGPQPLWGWQISRLPRVAVLGYPGKAGSRWGPTPTGLRLRWKDEQRNALGLCTRDPGRNPFGVGRSRDYPGLPYSATLGKPDRDGAQPQRGCGCVGRMNNEMRWGYARETRAATPLGLADLAITQGCRTRLPWESRIAMGPNPN